MKTTAEKIAVMEQWGKKTIQAFCYGCDPSSWIDQPSEPIWNWSNYDYRVKPEPRRFWLNICQIGGGSEILDVFLFRQNAEDNLRSCSSRTIEVVEVLP